MKEVLHVVAVDYIHLFMTEIKMDLDTLQTKLRDNLPTDSLIHTCLLLSLMTVNIMVIGDIYSCCLFSIILTL